MWSIQASHREPAPPSPAACRAGSCSTPSAGSRCSFPWPGWTSSRSRRRTTTRRSPPTWPTGSCSRRCQASPGAAGQPRGRLRANRTGRCCAGAPNARHGSVTAAAQALNYAQPSISHHMARLESETGAKLMERAGRGIRLTEAGQLLAERAEEILGRLDAAEAELAAHVGLKQEKVRLAAFGSALGTLAAAAVPALRADRAVTDVSLVQAEPADALRMLRVGEVDVALVFRYRHSVAPANEDAGPGTPSTSAADPLSDEDLRFQAVLDEPVYLITPATWPGGTGGGGPAAGPGGTGGGGPAAGPGEILNAGRAGHQHGSGQHGSGQPRSGQYGSGRRGAGKPASTSAAAASILAAYEGHRWIAGCERCQDVLLRLCRSAGFSPDIA